MRRRALTAVLYALSLLFLCASQLAAQNCAAAGGGAGIDPISAQPTPNGAQLGWSFVPGASKYCVMRSRDAGVHFALLATLSALTNSYLDVGAKAADVFQVIALSSNGARVPTGLVTYAGPSRATPSNAATTTTDPKPPTAVDKTSLPVAPRKHPR